MFLKAGISILVTLTLLAAACGANENHRASEEPGNTHHPEGLKQSRSSKTSQQEQKKDAVRAELATLYAETEPACRALQKFSSQPPTSGDLTDFQASNAQLLDLTSACYKHVYKQVPLELELAVLEGILTPEQAQAIQNAGIEAAKQEVERMKNDFPSVFRNNYRN